MSYAHELPTVKEALEHQLPQSHWLQSIQILELRANPEDPTKKVLWVTSMHLINGDGRVVCNCHISPTDSEVVDAASVPLNWGHLYCADSVTYLRRVVARHIAKGKQA